jgi:hypothetical protein
MSILGFALAPWQIITSLSVVAVVVGSCALRDQGLRNEGASNERTKITRQANEQGTQNAKRAEKKHADAHKPGSLDRLRRDPKTCADCDR